MSEPNFVPEEDLGASIGTAIKRWIQLHAQSIRTTTLVDRVTGESAPVIDLISQIAGAVDKTDYLPTSAPDFLHLEGRVRLRVDEPERALSVDTFISGVVLQIGHETHLVVRNNTGSVIQDGKAVYIAGVSAGFPSAALAKADAVSTADVAGVATHDIADQSVGLVTIYGNVKSLDTSAFSAATTLYLSDTVAGNFTSTPPPINVQVGQVIISDVTEGRILVDRRGIRKGPGDVWATAAFGTAAVPATTTTVIATVSGVAINQILVPYITVRDVSMPFYQGDASINPALGHLVYMLQSTATLGTYELVIRHRGPGTLTIDYRIYKVIP